MYSKAFVLTACGYLASIAPTTLGAPTADPIQPTHSSGGLVKRGNVNLVDGTPANGEANFPNTIGGDLSLCYDVGMKTCTIVYDVNTNICMNGWGCKTSDCKPKYDGFSNDKISAYAITGKTPMKCTFYYDENCRGSVALSDSSASGDRKVPNIVDTWGLGPNDAISSFLCGDPSVSPKSWPFLLVLLGGYLVHGCLEYVTDL